VVILASDDSSSITGTELVVDGGSAQVPCEEPCEEPVTMAVFRVPLMVASLKSVLSLGPNTQPTCPAGAVSLDHAHADMPAGSGPAAGSPSSHFGPVSCPLKSHSAFAVG
jgi:hypothetical protein